MLENINTMEYWDNRFESNWELMQGSQQTTFFANIAIQLMPNWLKNQIQEEKLTICDFGCAKGQAVDYMHNFFETDVIGVDFSANAVSSAKKKYPQYKFMQLDIENQEVLNRFMQFDVGYLSNVLEHITNPWKAAKNITQFLKKYLVIIMPFREEIEVEEHCNVFDLDSIPIKIDKFDLIFAAYKDCSNIENTLYADNQILLIYGKEMSYNRSVKLDSLVKSFEDNRIKRSIVLQQELQNMTSKICDLTEKNESLILTNNKYLNNNIELNRIIADKDERLLNADKTLNKLYESEKRFNEKYEKYTEENTKLNKIIADKDKTLANADKTINKLSDLEKELSEKCEKYIQENDRLNNIIANKDEILASADNMLNTLYSIEKELHESCNKYLQDNIKLNQIIENKDRVLLEADKTINALSASEKKLNEECERNIQENNKLNQIIIAKDELLANADKVLNTLFESEKELRKSCENYVQKNNEFKKIISEKDEIIDNTQLVIMDLTKKVNESELALMQKKERILEQEKKMGELEKEFSIQILDSDYMKGMIYNLQIENGRIKNTISWKITKPLRYLGKFTISTKQMLNSPKVFYAKIRNSSIYKRYFKFIIPQKVKDKLMNKYFSTPDDELILDNNEQERRVFENISIFEKGLEKDDQIILVFSGVKYIDSEGQRNIRLIHEAKKLGKKIIFSYWRWDSSETLEASEENMVKIPIDILTAKKIYFFEKFFRNIEEKCLLVEFPHPYVTQIIEIANSFGWKTVYDVIDDWEEFSKCGQAGWYRKEVERRVANIVDINVATAYSLRDKIKQGIVEDKPYYVITNGVDPTRMVKSKKIRKYNFSKGKVQIGYFGHLTDAWFDWDMLKSIAKRNMEWTFHIIGYGAPKDLDVPENIILYGRKSPEELPKFAAYWDVAIIPFINNELTRGVNPIKVFEYLQLRLPVIASEMPEIIDYPYVTLAVGSKEFEKAIIKSIGINMDESKIQKFIEKNTWENKCCELLNCIENIKKYY